VATVSYDFTVKIWNITSIYSSTNWTLIRTFTNHTNAVVGLEYINEDTIATGSMDNTIKIWSINFGETLRTINTNSGVYSLIAMITNCFYLCAGLVNGNINIYNIIDGSLIVTLSGHANYVNDLELIGNDLLASSSDDQTIRIWNLITYTSKFILNGHINKVYALKLISAVILASGSSDSTIKLWNVTDGKLIRTLTGHTSSVMWSIDTSKKDGDKILVSGSRDKTLKFWNFNTGECLNTTSTDLDIISLAILNSKTTTKLSSIQDLSKALTQDPSKTLI
jgi:WD40 repeat protein